MKKYTQEDRKNKIKQLIEQINTQLDGYVLDVNKLINFHKFRSQMSEKYSIRNCALIESQFSGAIKVAGYNAWKEEGYHVKKGERALSIIAPSSTKMVSTLSGQKLVPLYRATDEMKQRLKREELKVEDVVSYRSVAVFDIHQTNCPIEEYPDFIQQFYLIGQTEKFEELYSAIEDYRLQNRIGRFEQKPLLSIQNGAKGMYIPREHSIWVDPELEQKQFLKTTFHELAHAQMHKNSNIPTPLKEYQAELTAGVVANYFGLKATETSTAYIHNHIQDMKISDKEQLVEQVLEVANDMIITMEACLQQQYGLTKEMDKAINDIVALENAPEIKNHIPNTVIDLLDQDRDLDGVIDRYDADPGDSRVQTIGQLHERDSKNSALTSEKPRKISLNDRLDQLTTDRQKKKESNLEYNNLDR